MGSVSLTTSATSATSIALPLGQSLEQATSGTSREADFAERVLAGLKSSIPTRFSELSELPGSSFELKVGVAPYTMHLERHWRESIFKQLDQILVEDAWDIEDAIPSKTSWRTFIRLLIYCKFKVLPGLGFAHGNPMLSWINDGIRVNLTCYPNDLIRWTATRPIEGAIESSVGDTNPQRVRAVLHAYNDNSWLFDANG